MYSECFPDTERMFFRHCLDDLKTSLNNRIVGPLQRALRGLLPDDLLGLEGRVNELIGRIYQFGSPFDPSEEDLSFLRTAVLIKRRAYVAENEELQHKTSHPDILNKLSQRLEPIERAIESTWFVAGRPFALPRLSDYLSMEEIYSLQGNTLSSPSPKYDEKFGILLSPAQFLTRLTVARHEAELRGTETSVAFIDIDDFKKFNTRYGEFIVDRSVLPVFMRCVEGHVHSHGQAFRFGGDEYMLLLPNTTQVRATEFCVELQAKLKGLKFPGVEMGVTVSIGLTTAPPDSPLTERELQQRATDAKQEAKKAGKDRVAWIDGGQLKEAPSVVTHKDR